jgi:uncharacterized repeat protein (TIGR03899 family)
MSKETKVLNLSVIDLKALEKPAIKLIETIRDAVGIVFEPKRIVRRAKAEAEADIIRAEAKVLAEGVAARARRRIEWLENRRQENIEAVSELAMKFLPETVSTGPVDPDWTVRFFDYCQDVSNEQMQSLWAKLLSGEVEKPGSFSQRTLGIVRDMRPQDAMAFTKLATFFWTATDEGTHIFPMLRTLEPDSRRRVGLGFVDLLQLNALNLIHHDTVQSFRFVVGNPGTISYYGSAYTVLDKREYRSLRYRDR